MMKSILAAFFGLILANQAFAQADIRQEPWVSSLRLVPIVRYTQASVFGEGDVPSYRGFGYGGEIEYLIGPHLLMVGPYFQLITTKLNNSASSASESESLDGTFTSAGLKLYTQYTYLKIGAAQMKLTDKATGTVNNSKSYKSTGMEVGAGLNLTLSPYVSTTLGLDISYNKIDPSDNPISSRLDYMYYSFVFGLHFEIPSQTKK